MPKRTNNSSAAAVLALTVVADRATAEANMFQDTVANTAGMTSTPATVTVTVDAAPVVAADSAVTAQNKAVTLAVLSGAKDAVGTINPATVAISTAAAHGTTSVNTTTGAITYTPVSGFTGTDTFQYTVANTAGMKSTPATVTVTVDAAPTAPVPYAISAQTSGGTGYVDGSSGAPAGAPQLPTILSGYAVRPSWEVAGVDYAVGVPSGTVLKDPSLISMAGVSVNATNHKIIVTGNGITLNGYNFGLGSGWEVIVQGVNDTIENSKFLVVTNQGSSGTVLDVTSAASNFNLLDNEIDGNNVAVTPQVGSTVSIASSGTLLLRYNYFHNSGGDMVDLNRSVNPETDIIQYNLFANIGVNTAHADTIQWYNTQIAAGSDIGFNTVYQNVNQPGPGNGGLVPLSEGAQATMAGLTVNNDTVIQTANDTNGNFTVGFYADMGGTASNIVIHDLYIDPTGAMEYTGSPWFPTGYYGDSLANQTVMSNVINMVTGASVPVPTSTSKTSQGYYVSPDSSGTSPYLSDVYGVTASPSSGHISVGTTITLTVSLDENFVVLGAPTLTLNDGGVATYSGGSGTSTLTFTQVVTATDTAASTLAITAVNLPTGATVKNSVGNAANLSGAVTSFAGVSVTPTTTAATAPVVAAESAVTAQNKAVTLAVLSGAKDVVGTINPATVAVSTAAAHGTTSVNTTTGAITYTPASGFTGTDTFQYTVANTAGMKSTPATVTVTVDAAPTATADSATTAENQAVTIAVLAGDIDTVGTINPASVAVSTAAAHGTTSVTTTTGAITYTPASGFTGTDTFQYTVANTEGMKSTPATVTVTVDPGPIVTWSPASASGVEGTAITLGTVSDTINSVSGDTMTLQSLTVSAVPVGATLSDGTHSFTAAAGSTSVNVASWNLPSLRITSTNDTDFALVVTAVAQDAKGTITSASASETVTITPLAPTVTWSPASASGVEGTAIALGTISNSIKSLSGDSNTLKSLTISAIPVGATLSDGTHSFTSATGSTSVNVAGWSLSKLSLTAATAMTAALSVTAVVQSAQGNTNSATARETVTVIPPKTTYADGSPAAPTGTPELPNLFSGDAVRPPWEVAGVDYYVGVPTGTTLVAPTAANLPAGATLSGQTIIISESNVTIDGFNFSGNGGYGIYIKSGVSGTRITNNLFVDSSTTAPIPVNIAAGASNTYIAYNTMNGGGAGGNQTFDQLVSNGGSGLTVEYNFMENAPGRFVSSGAGSLVYEFNLLENGGWLPGVHLNFLQFGGGSVTNPIVDFNTLVQEMTVANGEGFQMYSNTSGSITGGDISNNTMISSSTVLQSGAAGPAISYMIHAGSNSQYPSPATGTVNNNYMNTSSAYGAFYPGLTGFTKSGNINLLTGKTY